MDVKVVAREAIKLVGIKVVGRREELSHRVPLAWLELQGKLEGVEHKVDPHLFYGVFPESDQLGDGGVNGVFTYWVGTEVSAFGDVPEGLTTLTIPAQSYAVATVKGTAAAIEPAYIGLFGWLKEKGRKTAAESYGFELYDDRRQAPTPPYEQFDYDIYKPLLNA